MNMQALVDPFISHALLESFILLSHHYNISFKASSIIYYSFSLFKYCLLLLWINLFRSNSVVSQIKLFTLIFSKLYSFIDIPYVIDCSNLFIYSILSITVHMINNEISHNKKSNYKWMIKFPNQIIISPILHPTFEETLIDQMLSHQLPIFFLFESNISNTINCIYIISKGL